MPRPGTWSRRARKWRAIVDVAVDGPIGRQPSAVAGVARPTPQNAVELIAHVRPGFDTARLQQLAHLVLHALHAFAGRTSPQVPPAILAPVMRTNRVAEKVERSSRASFNEVFASLMVSPSLVITPRVHAVMPKACSATTPRPHDRG